MKLYELRDVEIFRCGKWKGKKYTPHDLDEIVANFERFSGTWFRPAIKDGHHDDPGAPALGYVTALRREGDRLVADLGDMPAEVHKSIVRRSYDRVSIELAPEVERDGKKYSNVLVALSLLGTEVPEVDGLRPLRESLAPAAALSYDTDLILVRFAQWTAAYINDLPDAAFAVIAPGGKKDEQGKTVPRSLRHLPHHTAAVKSPTENESVDVPHLRNAISRAPQTDIPAELKEKAIAHLMAHAKALGIGEAAEEAEREKESADVPTVEEKMEIDELKKQLEAATAKVTELTAALEAEKVKAQGAGDTKKQIEEMSAKLNAAVTKAAELEKQIRDERIAKKVSAVRIPALRDYFRELYSLAARDGVPVVKFSRDNKTVEMQAEAMLDEMASTINKMAGDVLKAQTTDQQVERPDAPPDENPRAEADRRAQELMAKDAKLDYGAALKQVFAADAELKKAYARV